MNSHFQFQYPWVLALLALLPVYAFWKRVVDREKVDRVYLEEIALLDEVGRPAARVMRYIGYTLYPARDWSTGAVVRENYNLVIPDSVPPGRYTLVLRVFEQQGREIRVSRPDDAELIRNMGLVPLGAVAIVKAGAP